MASLRRAALLATVTALLAAGLTLGDPSPPAARANVVCDLGAGAISPATGAITGAIGIGNPVGDACNAITNPALGVAGKALDPLKSVASSIGNGVFDQITSWVTDGASWLVAEVVSLMDETTSPNLLSGGFVRQYRQMALIAVFLATLMLLFAVLEGVGRGDSAMLWRVFLVNLPLAAITTSVAYLVVQMLIATTDALSHQVAVSTAHNTRHFFAGAVHDLSQAGGTAGAAAGTATGGPGAGTVVGGAGGAVAAPLFVTFITAAIAAFAAFFVWVELLMRDAAVYVVALFMPMALAASIWPRWTGALRRTAELLVVVIFSKFVIVAIISLAAGLLAENGGRVEHILAAGALMLLACFAPFVLFKLVPFAEGAISAAYARQSASGGAVHALGTASSAQLMRRTAFANWGGGPGAMTGRGSHDGGTGGGSSSGPAGNGPGGPRRSPSGAGGSGAGGGEVTAATGASEATATTPAAAGAAIPAVAASASLAAAKGSRAAGQRLAGTATGQTVAATDGAPASKREASPSRAGDTQPPRPRQDASRPTGGATSPNPSEAAGGKAPGGDTQPPRPAPEPPSPKRDSRSEA